MATTLAAGLTFSLEQDGRRVVTGTLTGRDNRLRLEVDNPGVFAGAGDAAAVRTVARELAARQVVVEVVHQSTHLVSLGAVRTRWWQRRVTGSRHIRLGSLRGAWTSARARARGQDPVLPSTMLLAAPTLWPPAPTFMRRPVKSVGTTHDPSRGGSARLVLVKDAYWPGEGQSIFWLDGDMTIGSGDGCDVRLDGLEELHARLSHSEADEWTVSGAAGGSTRVNGVVADDTILRAGSRVELGPHILVYTREEYADHGRPHGGRIGGEAGRQLPQPPRSASADARQPPEGPAGPTSQTP